MVIGKLKHKKGVAIVKKDIFLIVLLVVICTLTACSNVEKTEPNAEELNAENVYSDVGKYHYEVLIGEDAVVNFLNKLDDEKYEVVDIVFRSSNLYAVFYKDVEQGGNLV